jgi:hypothetical protein
MEGKRIAKEENGTCSNDSQSDSEEKESDDGQVHHQPEDATREEAFKVNMVFVILVEFRASDFEVAELVAGAERAVFEKLVRIGEHMKPLYIHGHLDGAPVGHMMVDCGASINIMPLSLFKKHGHSERDLKRTNMSLSGFSGEPAEAKGIMSKELTIGSKTMPTTFFMVDVKGRYNMLLGQDWIHANGCVPSTLHQCVIQWVGDSVEVVEADGLECVAMNESQADIQGGQMRCLIGRTNYDYVSVSKGGGGVIPISIKPMISLTRIMNEVVINGEQGQ